MADSILLTSQDVHFITQITVKYITIKMLGYLVSSFVLIILTLNEVSIIYSLIPIMLIELFLLKVLSYFYNDDKNCLPI